MAPVAKMKTYGRSNNSTVNNSVDAFNVLLAKNMTKRLIGKHKKTRKKKFSIKELPARTRSDTVLVDDSLHVSTEDTFDKLLKGNIHNKIKKRSQSHNSNTSKLKDNKSKFISSITETSNFYSPVMTRSRKKTAKIIESPSIQDVASSISNNINDMTNPYLYRITEPTINRVDVSLEVEYVQKKDNSSSYIVVDKIPNHSQEVSNTHPVYNNIFTKTFRERQFIHCSTPLASIKSQKNVVNHTISPIKNFSSLVKESFEEIKKWDQKFPVINISDDKNNLGPSKNISDEDGFMGFSKKEQSQMYFCQSFQKDEIGPGVSENSIYLRNKKMLRSYERLKRDSSPISRTNLTVSLDTFSTFESQNAQYYKNHREISETPVNFITKRRKMYSDGRLKYSIKENRNNSGPSLCQNNLPHICDMSENESSEDTNNLKDIRLKELVVNLNRIPCSKSSSELESSMKNSLSSFEQFYSKSINQVTSQYQCDNRINTAKCVQEAKDLVVNITRNQFEPLTDNVPQVQHNQLSVNITQNVDRFENFYSENYSLSDSDTVDFLQTNSKIEDNCTNCSLNDESAIEDTHLETPNNVSKNISSDIKCNKRRENNLKNTNSADRRNSKSFDDNNINDGSGPLFDSTKCSADIKDTKMNAFERLSNSPSKLNGSSCIIESSLLQQSCTDHLSDIIESSVQESSQIDGEGFKIPGAQNKKMPPKILRLKAGKNWRRSFSLYRKSSILIGNTEEEKYLLGEKRRSSKGNESEAQPLIRDRRLSIRVVSIDQLHSAQIGKKTTLLEDYAFNTSYVPEQVLEDSLENSLRCLSLSGRRSITHNQLTVPVTAREVVLRRCGQTEPLPFSECYPESVLHNCQKIGEGVYGEVFLFRNPKGGTSVMKIIPIEGDLIVNGERQKKYDEILSEVVIAMELSNLRKNNKNSTSAFSEVQQIQCVQGRYPDKLLDLWELFEETHGSENDYPDIFRDDQLYIVLQLANGGKDLESYIFNNASQAYAMFKQVAFALAVAENKLLFEHRDLHWGNILLSTVEKNKVVDFCLDGETFSVPTRGVEVAIIDFTLSRIEYDGVVIFNDLALDPELFTAEGDYQFEIYKLMQKKNRNNWLEFEPYTNLLWLHYTLDKAITALRYKNPQSKTHKDNLMKLKQLYSEVLSYKSVKEFVLNCLL